ncbi:hypothetical protein SHANETTE_73 [Bacillus phage Shanette]|uniref:Uncharacterized protein n=1 Tax=Bacillus phage Shanette TaxID=1296656 RepID=S5M906_9CAUD|nr:hypothetical protein AVV46_gp073 [Bacillus phage Shanette]AGR46973.1 hypothetical protein SHANETTE_73 [Bacillus phage Shanette]
MIFISEKTREEYKMARTGLERFQARQGKAKGDEKAIHEASMKKQMTADMYDELKDEGNIEEAAMVVSRDGMKLLGQMLTNSIDSSMERVLDRKLDEKLGQLLSGLSKGIQEAMVAMQDVAVAKAESKIEEAVTKASEQIVAEINLSETPSIDKTIEKVKKNMGIDLGGKVDKPNLGKLEDIAAPSQHARKLPVTESIITPMKERIATKKAQLDTVPTKGAKPEQPKTKLMRDMPRHLPDTAPKEPFKWGVVPTEKRATLYTLRSNKATFLEYCPIIMEYLESHKNQPVAFKDINEYSIEKYNISYGTKATKFMDFVMLKDSRVARHSYGHYILK